MGIRLLDLSNNHAMLMVDFKDYIDPSTYYDTNSVEEAMEYFGLELDSEYRLVRRVDPYETALKTLGISVSQIDEFLSQLENLGKQISEEDALDSPLIFLAWDPGKKYKVGDRVNFAEDVFECIKEHRAHIGGNPYYLINKFWRLIEHKYKIPEWYPDNKYASEDLVSYKGKIWESLIEENTKIPEEGIFWKEKVLDKHE